MATIIAIISAIGTAILSIGKVLDTVLNFLAKKSLLVLPFLAVLVWKIVQYIMSSLQSVLVNMLSSVPSASSVLDSFQDAADFFNFGLPLAESIQIWSFVLSVYIASASVKAVKRWIPGLSE